MEAVKNQNEAEQKKPEKLSYEQLENVAQQLSQQNERLYQELQRVNMANTFKRLDYLFKVVEFKDSFDSDFVISCTDEVKSLMTIQEPKEKEEAE